MTTTAMERTAATLAPLLLRDREAADLLGISREKMYLMMRSGQVPGVVRIGRSIRISRASLERWIEEQAARP